MNRHAGVAPPELPVLPSLKGRGMAVLWNSHADLRDYLSIVEGDPALTASVLRAADSAFGAPSGPVLDAATALERIGVDAARQIVSAAFARAEYENLTRSDLHLEDFWHFQLAVATLCECFALADRRPPEEIEAAFTAGLLHQVGRLALIAHSPERYREVLTTVSTGVDPIDAEWQLLGDEAAHLTAQVATHWGFFEPLTATLANAADAEATGLAAILRDAREVATLVGFDEGFSMSVPVPAPLPAAHPRHAALAAIGGLERLQAEVAWFARANGGRTRLQLSPAGPAEDQPPALAS